MDNLSGGLPFAPKPKTYADHMADALYQIRLKTQAATSPMNVIKALSPFIGGGATAALNGSTEGDILNDPKLLARLNSYKPIGHDQQGLFGGPTFAKTTAPIPEGFGGGAPAPMPSAPAPAPQGAPQAPPQAPSFGPGSPNERVAQGFNAFGPSPLQTAQATPAPLPAPPALSAQAMAQGPTAPPRAPMPAPRPPEAPQEMNFFQRNAAMMQDPNNPGSFIDPMNAQRAQASGPDVINKFLQMFKDKA